MSRVHCKQLYSGSKTSVQFIQFFFSFFSSLFLHPEPLAFSSFYPNRTYLCHWFGMNLDNHNIRRVELQDLKLLLYLIRHMPRTKPNPEL